MSSILENLPESFYCPLCYDIMQDPVVDNNGNTYERHAITDWIQRNHTSPLTRGPLELTDLRPNRALKDMIDAALEQRAAAATTTTTPQSETKTSAPEDGFPPPSISLHVTTGRTHTQGLSCLATIQVPENTTQTPVDICVVIDTSGSMCSEAKMQGASGLSESHGLSILDVVQHATRTIIEALGPEDRLAIVAYSSQAHSVLPLTVMHNGGKALAKSALSTLRPSGSTNLWDGLKMGMDLLATDANPRRLTSCFILTDGCPNIVPPRGHLSMLRRYKDSASKNFSCVINTYGFGYNLDSTLLDEIAREGTFLILIFQYITANKYVWSNHCDILTIFFLLLLLLRTRKLLFHPRQWFCRHLFYKQFGQSVFHRGQTSQTNVGTRRRRYLF